MEGNLGKSGKRATSGADVKVIFSLTLVHFMGDFYASFINPLLPLFVERFSLTLAEVGLITGIARILAFIVQPSVGYLADRYHGRLFIFAGLSLAIVFFPLVGLAPSFLLLVLFISLGSIGASMYHPPCAGMVSTYAGRRPALSMSVFILGGTLAFGAGPLFITSIVQLYGLNVTPYTMILGLGVMVFLFLTVPNPGKEAVSKLGFIGSLRDVLGTSWKPIALLWVIMVLRAFVGQSFMTFIPVLYDREGYSLVAIGTMISLFTVGGAISGLLAGHLSDRWGYKPIFFVSHGLATVSLFLLLVLPGDWVFLNAFVAGFMALATLPLGVAMGQELAPKGKSMVSSLMMGLAFGTGGLLTPLTGKLGDLYSIRPVLMVVAMLPVLTTALIGFLPGRGLEKAS